MTAKNAAANRSLEVRERAVRLVLEGALEDGPHGAAIGPNAATIGCTPGRLLRQRRARGHGGEGGPLRGGDARGGVVQ